MLRAFIMSQTNPTQLKILVEFMEKHPSLAKNSFMDTPNGKAKKQALWSELIEKLNSNGPPVKSIKLWKKVWSDFKYNTKRKLAQNKKSLNKTGGGPPTKTFISNLEETAIAAAGLEASVAGLRNVKVFGTRENQSQKENEVIEERIEVQETLNEDAENDVQEAILELLEDSSEVVEENRQNSTNNQREVERDQNNETLNSTTTASKTDYISLINSDINQQKNFHEKLIQVLKEKNEIERSKVKCMEERNAISRQQLEIMRQEARDKLNYRKQKIETQLVKIDLKKTKLEASGISLRN